MNSDPLTGPMLAIVTAILATGMVVMLGVAIIFRWEIVPTPPNPLSGAATAVRLDHWTGEMMACEVRLTNTSSPGRGNNLVCAK
jgi:hypothetical protein